MNTYDSTCYAYPSTQAQKSRAMCEQNREDDETGSIVLSLSRVKRYQVISAVFYTLSHTMYDEKKGSTSLFLFPCTNKDATDKDLFDTDDEKNDVLAWWVVTRKHVKKGMFLTR
jgi:hypothetical protein